MSVAGVVCRACGPFTLLPCSVDSHSDKQRKLATKTRAKLLKTAAARHLNHWRRTRRLWKEETLAQHGVRYKPPVVEVQKPTGTLQKILEGGQ